MATQRRSAPQAQFEAPSAGELGLVYFFHGEEDFLVEEAVAAVIDAAVPAEHRSFNLDVLQGAEADVRDIVACASAFPMMAERRAVLVRDVGKIGKDELKLLLAYIEHPLPSTVLLLTAEKPDFRVKPWTTLRKLGYESEFKPLKEYQIPAWITKQVERMGMSVDGDACRLLSGFVGRSLRDLQQELDKLVLYAGSRKRITADDVNAVVGISRQYNIFELQRAISAGDLRHAEEILVRMMEAGNGGPYLVVMLTGFFTTLWKLHDLRAKGLSDDKIAAELKRDAWMLSDHFAALDRFSRGDIERALAFLLGVDDACKLGGDESILLQTMLVEILSSLRH